MDHTERTVMLIGEEGAEKLRRSRVAVFGIGGVGGYVTEALARAGVGELDLIDNDTVSLSNINRQIIALHSTTGRYKTETAAARIADISPECRVRTYNILYLPETADMFDFSAYDYVVDAIDNVTGKLTLIERARDAKVPVISSMGTGNKLHPELLELADIYDTSVCPLARVMRYECRKRGIDRLKVVYSKEKPLTPHSQPTDTKKPVPGSISFVPGAAGLIIAGEVVRSLIGSAVPTAER